MNYSGMPEGGPLVIPGPFHFEAANITLFFCRTQAAKNLQLFMPPGVSLWNPLFPKGMIIVALADYPKVWAEAMPTDFYTYKEICLFIPCLHLKSGPALFCPFIYLNDATAMCVGREIYGFPKKAARLDIDEGGRGGAASLTSSGAEIITLKWENEEERELPDIVENIINLMPGIDFFKNQIKKAVGLVEEQLPQAMLFLKAPILNWKRIYGVNSTLKKPVWAVNEVTSVRLQVSRIKQLRLLEVTREAVQFHGSPHDPLEKFTPLKTFTATRAVMDFTLPPGKVLSQLSKR